MSNNCDRGLSNTGTFNGFATETKPYYKLHSGKAKGHQIPEARHPVNVGFRQDTLFDWALALLVPPNDNSAPDTGQQLLALLALREGLAASSRARDRFAGPVLDMCEELLDAETTPPLLLQPLLGCLLQVDPCLPPELSCWELPEG